MPNTVIRSEIEDSYELSPLQQGMLIHTLRETGVGMYISQAVFTLTGVDTDALGRAWQSLVDRHSILRTTFEWEGRDNPQQFVHSHIQIDIEKQDWTDMTSPSERESRLKQFIREDRERGYDLTKPPLMRLFLFRTSEQTWYFIFSHHHLLLDGWSNPLLMNEFRRFYEAERRGQSLELPPTRPFRDYIEWLRNQDITRAEAFWRRYLSGIASPTPLPADRGALRMRDARLHYGEWEMRIDEDMAADLQRVARKAQVTLNTLLLGAWAVVLSRYCGERDVLFGMLVSGRPASLPGVESMIGMFLNTLPCRITVDPTETLSAWLKTLQDQQIELQQYEYSPLRLVQEWSEMPRGTPLFECVVDNNNTPLDKPRAGKAKPAHSGMMRKEGSLAVHQNVPLHLDIEAIGAELVFTITFDARRFEAPSMARIAEQLRALLRAFAENPERIVSDIPMMSDDELAQVLVAWNRTETPFPGDVCLHQLFERQAKSTPSSIAVRFESQQLDYSEVNRRANQLAHHLRGLGVRPGVAVGISIHRSPAMATALLAVLKAGGAYVPLDPCYPSARLNYMIADAGIGLLLAEEETLKQLETLPGRVICIGRDDAAWAGHDVNDPENLTDPQDLAYILYTSGSTGQPKGVAIPHRVPVARLHCEFDPFEPDEAVCVKTSLNFVDSIWEMFSAWRHGLCATLVPEEQVKDPQQLVEILAQAGATRIVLVPSLLRTLLDSEIDLAARLPKLRHWISSGEPLPGDLCRRFSERLPNAVLTNLYGTSEVWDATRCDSRERSPGSALPIGRPLGNVRVYVLDESMRPSPVGVPGELYVGGALLARGYWNRPDLTAEKFVLNPFAGDGERLYRTGDRVRWLPDGNIEYLGRFDQQIKLRGFRIEIDEIESVLKQHNEVAQAAVAVSADEQLLAYVVPTKDSKPNLAALRDFVSQRLPAHMTPAFFKTLDALPLTPNGKIDRRALPDLNREDRQAAAHEMEDADALQPVFGTPTEEKVAGIWSEMLNVEVTRPDGNFFKLGGHSLMAARVAMRLTKEFETQIPLRCMFETPTVAALALWIDNAKSGKSEEPEKPALERAQRGKEAPLSFAQQRMWFLDQLNPGSVSYTVPNVVRFIGEFDVDAMRQALSEMVRRHESLRTTFASRDGEPYQIIHPALDVELPLLDLTGFPERERDAAARKHSREQSRQPWDLVNGPLFRARIFRIAPDRHSFVLTMHHIITDGRSMGVFARELSILYRAATKGATAPLPPLPVQYADFAIWQRDWMKGELLNKQIEYWTEKLGGAAQLELPTDRPRPMMLRYNGASHQFELSAAIAQKLRSLGREEGATSFMVLLAGFSLLLARYSGQEDISVGTPADNRNRPELENLIGFFVNALVMRTDLSGNPTFRQLLQRVQKTCVEAYENQDVPFDKLVDVLRPQRDLGTQPLFQVMLVHENTKQNEIKLPGATWQHQSTEMETSNFDLLLVAKESENGIDCTLQYNSDIFEAQTIERMDAHLKLLFQRILSEPDAALSQISMLTDRERDQVLVQWNATAAPMDVRCIHELIAEQAALDPERIAASFEGRNLSRAELDRRGNKLARHLQSLGVGPDTIVALYVHRSLDMLVGLVGILKAGGAFLPLDPAYPGDRLEYMLRDSGARILLTQERLKDAIPGQPERLVILDSGASDFDNLPDDRPESEVCPSNIAYVIYTSGSTGTPKGVLVEHRNLANLVRAHNPEFLIGPESRIIQMLSLSFDAGVGEIFRGLAGGGTLILAQKEALLPGPELVAILRDHRITTAAVAPAVLAAMPAGAEQSLPDLAVVITAGEAFSPDLAVRWGRGRRIITGHGATETTVGDTIAVDWELERKPPLGRPLANMRVYVLDPWQQPVPVGTPGELYVSGAQVSRGYLNSPALTAARFLPDPFADQPGQRMYRTGDMVRWLGDGNLDFIGRTDHQVKIRGFRIELGEIETVLAGHEQVAQCVVAVLADGGVKRLAAYAVPKDGNNAPSVAELRAFLKERLPEHMIPAFLVLLPEMPLNANNKIDRKALPRPDVSAMALEVQYVAPRTDTERALAEIWADVLGLERVGVNDNFFELGGDSIMSIQLVARATKASMPLTPRDIFQFQTVASLAEHVEAGGSIVAAEQGVVTGDVPLTPVQSWFFEAAPAAPHHYNQWLSRTMPGTHNPRHLAEALRKVLEHHDVLRLRFEQSGGIWRQWMAPTSDDVPFSYFDLSGVAADNQSAEMDARVNELQASLDLAKGPIIRIGWFDFGVGRQNNMVVIIHHLIMDNVSWPIVMEDFLGAYRQLRGGQEVRLQPKTTSFKEWAETLQRFAQSEELQQELPYWLDSRRLQAGHLPRDRADGDNTKASADSIVVELDEESTEALLRVALRTFQVQINDVLLTALGKAVSRWTGKRFVVVTVEGHGREDIGANTNISRTVGWFTSFYPVLLEIDAGGSPVKTLSAVKEQLLQVPKRGIGYSVLRYMSPDPETQNKLADMPDGDIAFNYTGQQTGDGGDNSRPNEQESAAPQGEPKGAQVRLSESEAGRRRHPVEIVGGVAHGRLSMRWSFSRNLHNRETIERVAADFIAILRDIADEATGSARMGKTLGLSSSAADEVVEAADDECAIP